MKLQDIKTYSRYYPSLLFERLDGTNVPFLRLQLIDKLKASFPGAKITAYRTYGKLTNKQDESKRILNIVIIPSEGQRQEIEGGRAKRADFDILAHRVQICSCYVRISCWQESSHTELFESSFHDNRIEEIWSDNKEHLIHLQDNYMPQSCIWFDYMRAVDAMTGAFPLFNETLGLISPDHNYSASYFTKPLELIFGAGDANREKILNLELKLRSIIVENNISYTIAPVPEAGFHTQMLSRYPVSVADYLTRNDHYLSYVRTTDEAIALLVANVHFAFTGFEENRDIANTQYGESVSSLLHSLFFTHIDTDVVEVELIASLWESIDDNSLIYTYECTEWENVTYYSSFFRRGNRLHPVLRFITLALAIYDIWLRHRLEDGIPVEDMDQLLALLSIPESCLSILDGLVDCDFIDLPNAHIVTLVGGKSVRYTPAQNLLIRYGIFEESSKGVVKLYTAKESEIVWLLRNMPYYKTITEGVKRVFKLYNKTCWEAYNPLLNNVFVKARDHKIDYLKLWQERVRVYFAGEKNKETSLTLTHYILRVSMMTTYIEKQQLEDLIAKNEDEDINDLYVQLLTILPTESQLSCGLTVAIMAHYWLLYLNIFEDQDMHYADEVYHTLKSIYESVQNPSIDSFTIVDNLLSDGILFSSPSKDRLTELREHIVEILTNHIKL